MRIRWMRDSVGEKRCDAREKHALFKAHMIGKQGAERFQSGCVATAQGVQQRAKFFVLGDEPASFFGGGFVSNGQQSALFLFEMDEQGGREFVEHALALRCKFVDRSV